MKRRFLLNVNESKYTYMIPYISNYKNIFIRGESQNERARFNNRSH